MAKIKGASDKKAIEMTLNSGKFPEITIFEASILYSTVKYEKVKRKLLYIGSEYQNNIIEKMDDKHSNYVDYNHYKNGFCLTKQGVLLVNRIKTNKQALVDGKTHYPMNFLNKPIKNKSKMARKKTTKKTPKVSDSKRKKMTRISKAENTKRLRLINKMADDIQKKSGSSVKVVKTRVYKKKRKSALKEAGKQYVKTHK